MDLLSTKCCAVQEIYGLSSGGGPEQALKTICKGAFSSGARYYTLSGEIGKLYTFYWFSQPVYGQPNHQSYGYAFAEFLRKEKLGEVLESQPKKNAAFHPDHSNVMWIWAPDQAAVKAWWQARNPVPPTPAPQPLPKPMPVVQAAVAAPVPGLANIIAAVAGLRPRRRRV